MLEAQVFLTEPTEKPFLQFLADSSDVKKPGARPGLWWGGGQVVVRWWGGGQVVGFTTRPSVTSPAVFSAPTTSDHRCATRPGGTSAKAGCWVQNALASSSLLAPPGGTSSAAQHAAARPFRRSAGCFGAGAGSAALGGGSAALGGASTGLAVGAGAGAGVAGAAFAGVAAGALAVGAGISSNTKRDKSPLSQTRSVYTATLRRYRRTAPPSNARAAVQRTVTTPASCAVSSAHPSTPDSSAPCPRGVL